MIAPSGQRHFVNSVLAFFDADDRKVLSRLAQAPLCNFYIWCRALAKKIIELKKIFDSEQVPVELQSSISDWRVLQGLVNQFFSGETRLYLLMVGCQKVRDVVSKNWARMVDVWLWGVTLDRMSQLAQTFSEMTTRTEELYKVLQGYEKTRRHRACKEWPVGIPASSKLATPHLENRHTVTLQVVIDATKRATSSHHEAGSNMDRATMLELQKMLQQLPDIQQFMNMVLGIENEHLRRRVSATIYVALKFDKSW